MRVGRVLSLLLFRERCLACRWTSAGGVLTEDSGPESRRSLRLFVHSFIKHVSDALCVPGTVRGFGDKEISEM